MINNKYKHVMIKLFNIYNYTHVETYTKMILNPILCARTWNNLKHWTWLEDKNIIHDYFLPKTQTSKEKYN